MSKRIVIIGGGIIGLSTAWYCRARGHSVVLIDRGPDRRDGCSFGNAGMIVPSHFIPLAAPGMIRLGLKYLWNPRSPFYIRPRASWDLLAWLWRFKQSCSRGHVERASPLLRDLHLASRECFETLESELPGGFGLVKKGLAMLCHSESAMREEAETAEMAERLGVDAQVLGADEFAQLDPQIQTTVRGAVFYPRDCCLDPNRLMAALQSELSTRGCEFMWETTCQEFEREEAVVRAVRTSSDTIEADEVVIASGVWSSEIARGLNVSLPMQAGKGYSLTLSDPAELPSICSILTEARVAVTPIGPSLRLAGTMEIAGLDQSISRERVRGIIDSVGRYYPALRSDGFASCEPWVGLRPCSPDGLPYLGRSSQWRNVIISTGHAMMGISLAMVSGKIVGEIVDEEDPDVGRLELLSPDRFAESR